MAIDIRMPALSPTMEEGTLARWLVKAGDSVKSGDLLAEIETDKATMEFEAVDDGVIAEILVPEGTEGVKVGAVIARIAGEQDAAVSAPAVPAPPLAEAAPTPPAPRPVPPPAAAARADAQASERVKASPLARRIAAVRGIDLAAVRGSGPGGRIVRADIEAAPADVPARAAAPIAVAPSVPLQPPADIPFTAQKLSNVRKVTARRLTESKQTVPHFYLTVDCNLDALLRLRGELNAGLASRNIKLSVNDLLVKALAVALSDVPACNVQFAGDEMLTFHRVDISVAVALDGGLITPIIVDAATKPVSRISTEMADLAERARAGKLKPHEFQGGTASLSNLGMYGIKQFDAVINPPQGMILAVGAGEKRAHVVGDALAVATVMSATGSFDHRAIDGATGAQLMKRFRELVEAPLAMLA